MNELAPFTVKQREYLSRVPPSWFNVAEGGKRGGKNVLNTLAFCLTLEKHPNRIHLISGVSTATARLNILDCDGYGLLNYFEGRCREGQYQNRDCLYVKALTGEKIILVSGGGKNGDEKLIKGNTYGCAYITEANECAQIFLQEVFDRTLSSKDRKVFHDLNPKSPDNWYYKNVLDFHQKQQAGNHDYGYNYGHFTIADNMSVSDEQLKAVLMTYDPETVWYQRDILGERRRAQGLIYRTFANKPSLFHTDIVPRLSEINIGVDFGGTKSSHALVASGHTGQGMRYEAMYALISERHSAVDTTPADVDKMVCAFVERVIKEFGYVSHVYWDNESSVLGRGIDKAIRARFPSVSVRPCVKPPIKDRIDLEIRLMGLGRFFITKHCDTLKEALSEAVWDEEKEDERLDDYSTDIDSIDAWEYSWSERMRNYVY